MSSILIRNCKWIVTQDEDRRVLRGYSVYVEDGLIAEISPRIPVEADFVIDGSDMICLPGLINLHTHSPMSLLRGYADDLPLMEWLEGKIWPVERKLSPRHCYLGALVSFMEMVRTGTTFFVDMYWNPIEIARAADRVGLKGIVSIGVLDNFESYLRDIMIREVERFMVEIKDFSPRIIGAVGPHAPYTCSEELLLKCRDIAERENCLLHIHLAETRREQALFENKFGLREVDFLSNIGFLSPRVLAAHCVWLSKGEVKLLGEFGVRVAHCPVSNMKLGVGGVTPLPELLNFGVIVGLGTDGPASNNSLDMFETMKFCSLIHKHHRWDPSITSAQLVLDLTTINGAKAVVMENFVGRAVEGFAADLVLIRSSAVNLMPNIFPHSIISHLVYSVKGLNVSHVIVDGELIYSDGRFMRVNEEKVYSEFLDAVNSLLSS